MELSIVLNNCAKHLYLFLLYFLLASSMLKAQTGEVELTVTLTNVIEVTVVTPTASIVMNSSAHYQNGTNILYEGAIIISTNQSWDLSVKAINTNFTFGENTIAVSEFNVAISGEADGTNNGTLNLSTSDQLLINAASGTALTSMDITYGNNGGNAFLGTPAGAYENTYVFTVTVD